MSFKYSNLVRYFSVNSAHQSLIQQQNIISYKDKKNSSRVKYAIFKILIVIV